MTEEQRNVAFVRKHYADAIKYDEAYDEFFYENANFPAARFYFTTWNEAAADLAIEIGVTEKERESTS